jgi:hypothetical protein
MSVDHGGQLTRPRGRRAAPHHRRDGPGDSHTRQRHSEGHGAARTLRARYDQATAALDPPLAIVDEDAFDRNAADLTRRAAGRPIRVATKSLRCRFLIERALAQPRLPGRDVLLAARSPVAARHGHLRRPAGRLPHRGPAGAAGPGRGRGQARRHITIMVDSTAHLDVVDRALGDGHPEIRVCLELDVSWRPLAGRPLVHIGTRRSPVFTPRQAADSPGPSPGGRASGWWA